MDILNEVFGAFAVLYVWSFIILGVVQPFGAIIRILAAERRNSTYAIGLKCYLLAVIGYFIISSFLLQLNSDFILDYIYPVHLWVVPLFYVRWYIRHIWIWRKKRKNITEFDRLQLLNAPHEDRLLLDTYPKKKVRLDKSFTFRNNEEEDSHTAIIRKLPKLIIAK